MTYRPNKAPFDEVIEVEDHLPETTLNVSKHNEIIPLQIFTMIKCTFEMRNIF